jgi:hypothetical protein
MFGMKSAGLASGEVRICWKDLGIHTERKDVLKIGRLRLFVNDLLAGEDNHFRVTDETEIAGLIVSRHYFQH